MPMTKDGMDTPIIDHRGPKFGALVEDCLGGLARVQRPVAGRHARVVHDLAAAAAQLRPRAVRDERAAALRPPPAAEGARCALTS